MSFKILSKSFKIFLMRCVLGLAYAFSGCAPAVLSPLPPERQPQQPVPQQAEEPEKKVETVNPRVLAALQLTAQGRLFLKEDRPDDAIGVFEQAINLNPSNGLNYYYLSEAWLMKGDIDQAAEFNRLAEIYFNNDSEWLVNVIQQRERIERQRK